MHDTQYTRVAPPTRPSTDYQVCEGIFTSKLVLGKGLLFWFYCCVLVTRAARRGKRRIEKTRGQIRSPPSSTAMPSSIARMPSMFPLVHCKPGELLHTKPKSAFWGGLLGCAVCVHVRTHTAGVNERRRAQNVLTIAPLSKAVVCPRQSTGVNLLLCCGVPSVKQQILNEGGGGLLPAAVGQSEGQQTRAVVALTYDKTTPSQQYRSTQKGSTRCRSSLANTRHFFLAWHGEIRCYLLSRTVHVRLTAQTLTVS